MTITEAEGQAFAAKFIAAICEGFEHNNHNETMRGLFAEKVYMSSSDGLEGDFSEQDLMAYMKEGWGSMIDSGSFGKPLVCVDTDQSRIVIAAEPVWNFTGVGLVTGTLIYIIVLNDNKQVTRWSGIADPNDKQLLNAAAKMHKKLGKEMPSPKTQVMAITLEEGLAWAHSALKATVEGFAKNSHKEICRHLFADKLSWDWSDGTKGEGSYDEVMDVCTKNWSSMVDNFLYSEPTIAVDTNRSIIIAAFQAYSNLTGGFSDENNPLLLNVAYCYHLGKDKKCFKWNMCWNNNDPSLQAAVAKVTKRLQAAEKTATKSIGHQTFGLTSEQYIQQGQ